MSTSISKSCKANPPDFLRSYHKQHRCSPVGWTLDPKLGSPSTWNRFIYPWSCAPKHMERSWRCTRKISFCPKYQSSILRIQNASKLDIFLPWYSKNIPIQIYIFYTYRECGSILLLSIYRSKHRIQTTPRVLPSNPRIISTQHNSDFFTCPTSHLGQIAPRALKTLSSSV